MESKRSVFVLQLRLPASSKEGVEIRDAQGAIWNHNPGAAPADLKAEALWKTLENSWPRRRQFLHRAGALLGNWLFDQRSTSYLDNRIEDWTREQPRLRVELRVSEKFISWPWECSALKGIGHLATHQAITFVRISDKGEQPRTRGATQLVIDVVGVQPDDHGPWPELTTRDEVERIREEIEGAATNSPFSVRVDVLGEWPSIVKRYGETGPPDIFHFAGHGLKNGKGLVFRNTHGETEEIPAEMLASLLSRKRRGRQTYLAFLNACTTVASTPAACQPFGGLAHMLVQHGVPAVVGLQTPIEDDQARHLSSGFYSALAAGYTVDCALQKAREKLFYLSGTSVAWAFASLSVSGETQPLWRLPSKRECLRPSASIVDFGHEEQRQHLTRFLRRQHPMAILIHGEERTGHRHVARRVQHDLERSGNVLWRPVATMRWFVAGEPLLSRLQLTAGIALALSIPDTGHQKDLEEKISREIAARCAEDRAVAIDLIEIITLKDEDQADALVSLIQDLWSDLMGHAFSFRSVLPVFLIVCLAYPQELPRKHRHRELARRQRSLSEAAIERISQKVRFQGKLRVEVLPVLMPIEHTYVAKFLEDVLELDFDDAATRAENLMGLDDNEGVLERMERLLTEWDDL